MDDGIVRRFNEAWAHAADAFWDACMRISEQRDQWRLRDGRSEGS